MDARRWPVREERLLTIHTLLLSLLKSQYIFTTTSYQEGPHQKLFFHLQESEDERMARLDDKYRKSPCSLFNGNHFSSNIPQRHAGCTGWFYILSST